ncbi:hypothetical protein R1sor_010391 [Riccia sorocarpa]|uniref:Protein arginine N-methyltransferase domain-containing protein n=1 Tax=Riccia sorocarpa TaxID=122646 RepID=A0ABD3HXW6_9MARC
MAETGKDCVLQQRLNPLTGESEWVVVTLRLDLEDSNDQCKSTEKEGTLWQTTYLDMLNDVERNRAYDKAIRKAVSQGARHVLDIGAGTGLLSMMAARAMKESYDSCRPQSNENLESTSTASVPRRVTACECYLPMFRLARTLLKVNSMGSSVRLVLKRSDEMKVGIDLSPAADLLVSEILDSELLGEGLIPTLRHAHTHLLAPGARSVPHRATIYAQKAIISGGAVTYLALRNKSPMDCALDFPTFGKDYLGSLLLCTWVLDLDEEGTISYSTAPVWAVTEPDTDNHCWKDHWKQCVWFFQRNDLTVVAGKTQIVQALHDEISVKYGVRSKSEVESQQPRDQTTSYELDMRPQRIGILGNNVYRRTLTDAVSLAVRQKNSPLCLVVDDSILCTISAGAANVDSHVIAMFPGLKADGPSYVKAAAVANGLDPNRFQVLGEKAVHLSSVKLNNRKVDLLMAEPYYRAYEDLQPWRQLRFWFERTALSSLLVDNAAIIPCRGILRGVALFLPDLWRSRKSLSNVEGFEHSSVNKVLGACGELPYAEDGPILAYSVWQCGQSKELTDCFTLMEFDFTIPLQAVEGSVQVPILTSGVCHGVALWIDWVMSESQDSIISTGPTGSAPSYWKQGVKLLNVPLKLEAEKDSYLRVSAVFDPTSGDIKVGVESETAEARNSLF